MSKLACQVLVFQRARLTLIGVGGGGGNLEIQCRAEIEIPNHCALITTMYNYVTTKYNQALFKSEA